MSDRAEVGAGVEAVDLSGRTALVTGATGGIGRETALALGRLGARVVVHGRSRERGERVVERLRATAADGAELRLAEFASQGAVRELAAGIRDEHDRLDVLVNNAGGVFREGRLTGDGVERTMAVNHLAPFLLTNLLWPSLRRAPAARVVTVSSGSHRGSRIDFEALRTVGDYSAMTAYGRSKLANVLFTRELARRFDAAGVAATANCLHPGTVPGTGITRHLPAPVHGAARLVGSLPLVSDLLVTGVVGGAETPVYLAASPAVADVSGEYFVDCQTRTPSRRARDDATARRLWTVSEELTGLDGSDEPRVPAPDG